MYMRVAFISHYSALYGANRSLLAFLIDGLKEFKVQVYVICLAPHCLTDGLNRIKLPGMLYIATIFKKNKNKTINWFVIRFFEKISKITFPVLKSIHPILRAIKRLLLK